MVRNFERTIGAVDPGDETSRPGAGNGGWEAVHALLAVALLVTPASAQMASVELGAGWRVDAMAQAFPIHTSGGGGFEHGAYGVGEFYLTQAAAMIRVSDADGRWSLRVTPNFEAFTIEEGEITPGAWGEGFLDKRHPHTVLHEAMVSWASGDRALSFSLGKGFAPYGTPDPMSRPGSKYPTNHHLSQILERWVVSGAWKPGRWSLEAGVFGGAEPTGPHDLSNITSFGDSWSARVGYELTENLRATVSYGSVLEPPEPTNPVPGVPPEPQGAHPRGRSRLVNLALLQELRTDAGRLEWLLEASGESHTGSTARFWAVLGELRLDTGSRLPYLRVEYASRPEFARFGAPGTEEFYRYGLDDEAIGGNRWLIGTVGYGHRVRSGQLQLRPFVELQGVHIGEGWGGFPPEEVYGAAGGWVFTTGFRIYLGGDPMPMGSYGVLDPMAHRSGTGTDHTAH